jgi:hypothetical protein
LESFVAGAALSGLLRTWAFLVAADCVFLGVCETDAMIVAQQFTAGYQAKKNRVRETDD